MASEYRDTRSLDYDSLSPMQQQNSREQASLLADAIANRNYHSSFVHLVLKRLELILETKIEEEKRALEANSYYAKLKHNK